VDQGGTKSDVWKQGAGDSSWTKEGQSQMFGNRMLGTVVGPRRDKVKMFGNRVLGTVGGPRRDKVRCLETGCWGQ
jgi:hypothetical protein